MLMYIRAFTVSTQITSPNKSFGSDDVYKDPNNSYHILSIMLMLLISLRDHCNTKLTNPTSLFVCLFVCLFCHQ